MLLKLLNKIATIVSLVVSCALIPDGSARARPQYLRVFKDVYPTFAPQQKKPNCALCHPTRDKTKKDHYGAALKKELGEKKVKDEKRIAEALRNLKRQKRATGEWGERLENQLEPCTCREKCDTCRARSVPLFI